MDKILYNLLFEKTANSLLFKSKDGCAILSRNPGKPICLYVKEGSDIESVRCFLWRQFNEGQMQETSGIIGPTWALSCLPIVAKSNWEIAAFFLPKQKVVLGSVQELSYPSNTKVNIEMLAKWIKNFYEEALLHNLEDSVGYATALIRAEKIYTLQNHAMGMIIPLSYGMSRLNLIYTAPEYRGQGYGKEIVLSLAKKVQDEGLLPVLYARVANKAAMATYQSLGFVEAGRLTEMRF